MKFSMMNKPTQESNVVEITSIATKTCIAT
jgi:hypothetical protein